MSSATSGAGTVNVNTHSLTLGGGTGSSFSGVLQQGSATSPGSTVTKVGSDTVTLSGNNTFSGNLTINGGTLAVGLTKPGTTALGLGNVNLAGSGARLALQGQTGFSSWNVTNSGLQGRYYAFNNGGSGIFDFMYPQIANINNTYNKSTSPVPNATVFSTNGPSGPATYTTFTLGGTYASQTPAAVSPAGQGFTGYYPSNTNYMKSQGDPGLNTGNSSFSEIPVGGTTRTNSGSYTELWTGQFNALTAGTYTFSALAGAQATVYVDPSNNNGGQLVPVVQDFVGQGGNAGIGSPNTTQPPVQAGGAIFLTAGLHNVEIFYRAGGSIAQGSPVNNFLSVQAALGSAMPTPQTDDVLNAATDLSQTGFVFATPVLGTTAAASQSYANNVVVTANSSIDVSGSLAASLGTLQIGVSSGPTQLSVTSADATSNPYSLTMAGTTTLTGNSTFNVQSSAGSGAGTLVLANVAQSGGTYGVTKTGPGSLRLTTPNTFGGGLTIGTGAPATGGTVVAAAAPFNPANASRTQIGSGTVTLAGGTLALQGQQTFASGLSGQYYYTNTTKPASTLLPTAPASGTSSPNSSFSFPRSTNTDFVSNIVAFTGSNAVTTTSQSTVGSLSTFVFPNAAAIQTNANGNANIAGAKNYLVVWTGEFNAPKGDTYNFQLGSVDGSNLYVDPGQLNNSYLGANALNDPGYVPVVDDNYGYGDAFGANYRSGSLYLSAGPHNVVLTYWHNSSETTASLSAQVIEGNITLQPNQFVQTTTGHPLVAGTAIPNATDPSQMGFYTLAPTGSTQSYANNVVVTADSTIDISGGLTATMGPLQIGVSSGGTTLGLTSADATASPYSLTFGAVTLAGNSTINVANSAGSGLGTMDLGAIGDGGHGYNLTKTGPGTLVLTAPGSYTGTTTINGGILNFSIDTDLGTPPSSPATEDHLRRQRDVAIRHRIQRHAFRQPQHRGQRGLHRHARHERQQHHLRRVGHQLGHVRQGRCRNLGNRQSSSPE